jgi:uncharacterized glyoxalase superfamily metalloenzyme YdcJ
MSTPEIPTWQLRARFATALSAIYGAEVPAYTTLVEVSEAVNRDYVAANPEAERLGSLDRVTAERHGAFRVGTPAELADVADLFAAFGMYPVGFYDLRDDEMASQGLAYYHQGDPTAPVVYEDFLPASAAGIFRSNLDADSEAAAGADKSGYTLDWMAGAIGHHVHDPYNLYDATAQEPPA